MKRTLVTTKEGSLTVFCSEAGETFHSMYGAVQESAHVFVGNGFLFAAKRFPEVNILEVGFGTGLNALLTLDEASRTENAIRYTAVDAYPLSPDLVSAINYAAYTDNNHQESFMTMHTASEGIQVLIEKMAFTRYDQDIRTMDLPVASFNLVYFDAFSAIRQPWMWEPEIFRKLYNALQEGGVLVTYAARSSIKRALVESGFTVEKLPGAKGKREMMRAIK